MKVPEHYLSDLRLHGEFRAGYEAAIAMWIEEDVAFSAQAKPNDHVTFEDRASVVERVIRQKSSVDRSTLIRCVQNVMKAKELGVVLDALIKAGRVTARVNSNGKRGPKTRLYEPSRNKPRTNV